MSISGQPGHVHGDDNQLACDTQLGDHDHRTTGNGSAFNQILPLTRITVSLSLNDLPR
jgi:hypothetical protein